MVWTLYASPYFWSTTAMVNNDFSALRAPFFGPGGPSTGEVYMAAFDIPYGAWWQWGAILVLLGVYAILGCIATPLVLMRLRNAPRPGARRPADESVYRTGAASSTRFIGLLGSSRDPAAQNMKSITLAFEEVQYSVVSGTRSLHLLKGVSGIAHPRSLTALMGASGAGKTTLLDCLAFRKTAGSVTGRILLNGHGASRALMSGVSAYVEQTDVHHPLQTVREAIEFSATLRFLPRVAPAPCASQRVAAVVKAVLALLDIESLAERPVYSLARGELKVLSIAVELASGPSILFLDEPTTGCDAQSAHAIVYAMRRVADSGKTVLSTIHQPSPSVFASFDTLILLSSGGYQAYCGPIGDDARRLQQFMTSAGLDPLPADTNPAVWAMDCAAKREKGDGVPVLTRYFERSQLRAALLADIAAAPQSELPMTAAQLPQLSQSLQRFRVVARRSWLAMWRNPRYNLARMVLAAGLGIFYGCLYFRINQRTFSGLQSALGSLLATSGFIGVVVASAAIPHHFGERDIVYRESAAGVYPRWTAATAALLVELPYVLAMATLSTIPYYFMAGLRPAASSFFLVLFTQFETAWMYLGTALIAVAAAPQRLVAQVAGGMAGTLYFLFGAVLISPRTIHVAWKWLFYLVFQNWLIRTAAVDQFQCAALPLPPGPPPLPPSPPPPGSGVPMPPLPPDVGGCYFIAVPTATSIRVQTQYQYMSGELEFNVSDVSAGVGISIAFGVVYAIGAILALHFISFERR